MHCTLAGPTSSHNSSFIYCSLTLRQSDGRVTKESNDLILFDSRQPSDWTVTELKLVVNVQPSLAATILWV